MNATALQNSRNRIGIDARWLEGFCRRYRIHKLSLFGSALHKGVEGANDIDLLVEFFPDARVSLFDVGGMMHELTAKLGKPVDLRTPDDLSRYFRKSVMAEAELLYAA